jgi:hypothetical protein
MTIANIYNTEDYKKLIRLTFFYQAFKIILGFPI